jgi:hypothetical protein
MQSRAETERERVLKSETVSGQPREVGDQFERAETGYRRRREASAAGGCRSMTSSSRIRADSCSRSSAGPRRALLNPQTRTGNAMLSNRRSNNGIIVNLHVRILAFTYPRHASTLRGFLLPQTCQSIGLIDSFRGRMHANPARFDNSRMTFPRMPSDRSRSLTIFLIPHLPRTCDARWNLDD